MMILECNIRYNKLEDLDFNFPNELKQSSGLINICFQVLTDIYMIETVQSIFGSTIP